MRFCADDGQFGPQSLCREFDFTVHFENVILSILPAVLFSVLAWARLYQLRLFPTTPEHGFITSKKTVLFAAIIWILASLGSLISWLATNSSDGTDGSGVASLALGVLCSIMATALAYYEHAKKSQPSVILDLYLMISILCDFARLRTLATAGAFSNDPIFMAFFVLGFAARVLLLVADHIPSPEGKAQSETTGLFSRLFVFWALPLFLRGRKGPMLVEDLPDLDDEMAAGYLQHIQTAWAKECNKTQSPSLARTIFDCFLPVLISPILPGLIRALAQVIQPLMVSATLSFIQSYSDEEAQPLPAYYGWSLAAAFLLVYLTFTASTSQYFYYVYRGAAVLRSAFVEMIYVKLLKMDVNAAKELGGANATNLMSVDIERIVLAIDPMHQLWSSCVTIGIGLYILYTQLGTSFMAGLIVAAFIMIITPLLSRNIDSLQDAWSAQTDKRVRLIAGVIAQIKGIKLSAYENPLMKKVGEYREKEIDAMKAFWKDFAVVVCITNTAQNMLSLFALGTYAVVSYITGQGTLDTNRLFTSYTVLNIIAAPLFQVGQQYGTVLAAYSSLKRIETFLKSDEKPLPEQVAKSTAIPEATKHLSIAFRDVSVGWADSPVLSNVTTDIRSGKFTMIIGRVAQGKSTFLQTLLRETVLLDGTINVPQDIPIAYCSQNVWLQTGRSIRANIQFMSSWDPEWYDVVFKACGLDIDFADNDEIVAKGLSGGQKARIALARAVYSKAKLVLLDDVFSALDVRTEEHIFTALFGAQGLLLNTTVVLATNGVHRLEKADWIIMLSDGTIAEQGTPTDLLAQGGRTSALMQEFSKKPKADTANSQTANEVKDITPIPEPTLSVDQEEADAQEDLERIQHGSVGLETYKAYICAAGSHRMIIYGAFLVLTVGIQIFTPVYLQIWSTANDHGQVAHPGPYIGGYAAVEVFYGAAFTIVFYYVIMTVVPFASKTMHAKELKAVLSSPMSFFESSPPGRVINRFSQDIFIIDFEFPLAMHDWAYETTRLVGSTILMIVAAPYLALVVVFVAVVFFFIQRFYLATSRQLRRLDLASKSPLYSLFAESADLDGLMTIRAFRSEQKFVDINSGYLRRSQKPFYHTNVAKLWLIASLGLLTTVINTSLILIAVGNRHSTSAGLIAVGLVQAVSLQDMINLVVVSWTALEIAAVAIERVQEFCNLKPEEESDERDSDDVQLVVSAEGQDKWTTDGTVAFENVVARYSPDSEPALKGISFEVPGGQKIGVCGRTGSGKSTVLLSLFRMLDIEGSIRIDNRDITTIARKTVRDQMSIIPQDPFVLDMTVRENLDPSGSCTDAEIWEAIEACHLKPALSSLPTKLDHELSSQSRDLSRGQRQLLCIARVLLRRRKIVVMDEATGSLDVESDKDVQETIRDALKGCTIITVAHRIKTIEDYEWVVVLDKGRVVEFGVPGELRKKSDGMFKRLADGAEH